LGFEEWWKDIGCKVCNVLSRTNSGTGRLPKSPRKSGRSDLFPEPDCITNIRWEQLRINFPLRKKKELPDNTRNVLLHVWLLTFELHLCYQVRACVNLYCGVHGEGGPAHSWSGHSGSKKNSLVLPWNEPRSFSPWFYIVLTALRRLPILPTTHKTIFCMLNWSFTLYQ
jgi:hypothetical protein